VCYAVHVGGGDAVPSPVKPGRVLPLTPGENLNLLHNAARHLPPLEPQLPEGAHKDLSIQLLGWAWTSSSLVAGVCDGGMVSDDW